MIEKILKKIAPFALAAGIALGITACPIPEPEPVFVPKDPVMLVIDDFQYDWINKVQDYLVDLHSGNNIPVTLGVIPQGIEIDTDKGREFVSQLERWKNLPNVELAQHGYSHGEYELLEQPYQTQYLYINRGKNLMNSIGVFPKNFVAPYGNADDNTVQVLFDLNFHSIYGPLWYDFKKEIKLEKITPEIYLAKNDGSGKDSVFKDYSVLLSEIKDAKKNQDFALILYHMQDFADEYGDINYTKGNQLIVYGNNLKRDGYDLMTVEQYSRYITQKRELKGVSREIVPVYTPKKRIAGKLAE